MAASSRLIPNTAVPTHPRPRYRRLRWRALVAAAAAAALCATGLAPASAASQPTPIDHNGRAVYVVCPDGHGGYELPPLPGGPAAECDSLAEALAKAAANNRADDLILLRPGLYCPVNLPDTGTRLYLQGIPVTVPPIDEGGGAVGSDKSDVEAVTFAKFATPSCPSVPGNAIIRGGNGLSLVFLSHLAVDGNGDSGFTTQDAALYGIELVHENARLRNVVVKRAHTGLSIVGGVVSHSAFVKNVDVGVQTGANRSTWIQDTLIADTDRPGSAQGIGLLEGTMSNYAANADTLRNVTIFGNEIGLGRSPGIANTFTKITNSLIAGNDVDCDYFYAGDNSNSRYNAVSGGCPMLAATANSETLSSSVINTFLSVDYVGGFQPYFDPHWEPGFRLGDPSLCSPTDQLEHLRTSCHKGAISPIGFATPPLVDPPISTYIEYTESLDFGEIAPGETSTAAAYISNKRGDFITATNVSVSPGFVILTDDCSLSFIPHSWISASATPQTNCMVRVGTTPDGPLTGTLTVATNRGTITIPLNSATAKLTLKSATPTFQSTVKVGVGLTVKPGAWTAGTAFAVQWQRDGKNIAGATKLNYTPAPADRGKKISVTVSGTKAGYTSVTKKSAAKTVGYGTLKTATPTITGTKKVGKTLTAKPGTWKAGPKKPALKYQWYAGGKAIKGATKSTYKLKSAQVGKAITVKVKGSSAGYTTVTKTSKATAKVKK